MPELLDARGRPDASARPAGRPGGRAAARVETGVRAAMAEVMVLGYGNTLRRDDAVGPLVAEAVSRWGRPDVVALAVPQLVPELAEPLSRARLAIFVDAALTGKVCEQLPTPCEPSLNHTGDPGWLLAL